jgi:hypothetical protein
MTDVVTLFDASGAGRRKCGSCSLCCRLLAVRSLNKPAGVRCSYQRHSDKGECCKVYAKLESVSPECRLWSCRWVLDDAGATRRPDHVHYVIDMMPDFVLFDPEDGTTPTKVPIVQVWVDPKHPDAHRDPALRAWLDEGRHIALVRYDQERAFLLSPPSRSEDRQWHEKRSMVPTRRTHSAREVIGALAERGPA